MFIDRAKIYLVAGKGGDGSVSFRHEKCVEFGGPDGGNGGRGGSISFVSKDGINTLSNYRQAIKVKAEDGDNGHKKNSFGKAGEDVYLTVPTGTVISTEDGQILADLDKPNLTFLACKGGKGGRGNKCFASSTNRTPRIAENGTLGEKKTLILELKLLADCGLVGLPSVGKSTILSVVSNAKPKIAEYHFTTLEPMLGVVNLSDSESFVLADLPGLIKGASLGKGLGFVFLRHIERCRVIIHVIDINSYEGDPFDEFETINKELGSYKLDLLKRPMIIALNKIDEEGAKEKAEIFKKKLEEKYPNKYPVFEISALKNECLKPLLRKAYELVQATKPFVLFTPDDQKEAVYKAEGNNKLGYKIVKRGENKYEIISKTVVDTYRKINIKTEEGMMKLMSYINSLNISSELKKMGVKSGATIIIDDFDFEYIED